MIREIVHAAESRCQGICMHSAARYDPLRKLVGYALRRACRDAAVWHLASKRLCRRGRLADGESFMIQVRTFNRTRAARPEVWPRYRKAAGLPQHRSSTGATVPLIGGPKGIV
jgi:hypothetical protein